MIPESNRGAREAVRAVRETAYTPYERNELTDNVSSLIEGFQTIERDNRQFINPYLNEQDPDNLTPFISNTNTFASTDNSNSVQEDLEKILKLLAEQQKSNEAIQKEQLHTRMILTQITEQLKFLTEV